MIATDSDVKVHSNVYMTRLLKAKLNWSHSPEVHCDNPDPEGTLCFTFFNEGQHKSQGGDSGKKQFKFNQNIFLYQLKVNFR